ncbi:hypothetical protein M9Y10_041100 [Tritrichomonas musculus]|uniref:non-specific serine/threonine protein kinase n=1 Tax=Tritrichomonas musculus TaxID=1915356 RepID=A0ABR2K4C7_9EUKA
MLYERRQDDKKDPEKPMANINLPTNYKINSVSRAYPDVGQKLYKSLDVYESIKLNFGDIEKYTVINMIGSGRFSVVFRGTCENGAHCAIKTYRPIPIDFIKREIFFTDVVRNCPNTIQCFDLIQDPLTGSIAHVCEYIQTGRRKTEFQSFTLEDVRYYMYQLLRTLDACHSIGIMHRDVKPDNILFDRVNRQMRLIDWGLADIYFPKQQYSTGVGTLRYRSPELFLNYRYYDYSVDIWAAGITMGEMLIRYPFFDVKFQDELIYEVTNLLTTSALLEYAEKYGIEVTDSMLRCMPDYTFFEWSSLINQAKPEMRDPDASDLLRRMLIIDHQHRITAHEALQHKFFEKYTKEEAENQNKEKNDINDDEKDVFTIA